MTVDFSGVCNANLQNSKFLGPLPEAFSVKIAQPDAEIKALIMVTRREGSVHGAALHGQLNGQEDKNLLDGKPVRGSAKWDGEELILESWNPGCRSVHARCMFVTAGRCPTTGRHSSWNIETMF